MGQTNRCSKEGHPWYVQFPKGYWLYERSKHLWVSGYPIKAKLFKTPQEFALHLIWLLSASKDYKDCCCVHCNLPSLPKQPPAGDDTPTLAASESPVKSEKLPPKVTPVPLPQIPGQPQSRSPAPTHRAQAARPIASSASPIPIPSPTAAKQTQTLAPSPAQAPQAQPQPQVQAQVQQTQQTVAWSLKSPLLVRVGELVWYKNGATWRLGIISASNNQNGHELVPLGHGIIHHPKVMKMTEDMRPFYAFSVPSVNIPDLKDKVFDEIPWDAMIHATAGDKGKLEVIALDASKMAASKIDYSYSLWSRTSEDLSGKVAYYGCFFGAERIEIGDCLRLRSLPMELSVAGDSAILGLRTIFTSKDYPGAVLLCGHIYMLVKGEHANAVPPETLPLALRDESNWRNSINAASNWRWILVKENLVLQEASIRGRFYPTHRLMPILDPPRFQHAVQQGQVDDQLQQLNNRMDGMGHYIGRKWNRINTLGSCIAHGVRLALEPHIREDKTDSRPFLGNDGTE